MRKDKQVEDLLRREAPRVLGVLVRRHGRFDECEDAVQEALVAASMQWPDGNVPGNPYGWLITVASRRLTDRVRSEAARRRREEAVSTSGPDEELPQEEDDVLTLLYMCCHPALTPASQVALTLRAVGGLRTSEIARAFLVPETTMAQRISRAKQKIKASGVPFRLPPEKERAERLGVVLQILYLIFNEGYTATSGPDLARAELTGEAIRLARELRKALPEDGEVAGLLALMLLTDARRPARTTPDGSLIPLAEQDRKLWNRELIREGESLVTGSLSRALLGPYQIQAAIAALHDEAEEAEETDWRQILALYGLLERISDNPVVKLNRAVALSMVRGPRAGLVQLEGLEADGRLAGHHRLDAVRAHLLEMAGDLPGARAGYRTAARRTTSLPEQRYLEGRAARIGEGERDLVSPPGIEREWTRRKTE